MDKRARGETSSASEQVVSNIYTQQAGWGGGKRWSRKRRRKHRRRSRWRRLSCGRSVENGSLGQIYFGGAGGEGEGASRLVEEADDSKDWRWQTAVTQSILV